MRCAARGIAVVVVTLLVASLLPAAGCGGRKKSGLTIGQMLDKARTAGSPELQARELTRVARLQYVGYDRSGAAKTLAEARTLVPAESDPQVCGPVLVDIARLFAEMGEKGTANDVLKQARAKIDALEDPISQAKMLAELGAIQGAKSGGLGESGKARRTLEAAAAAAAKAEERFQADALAAVAMGYVNAELSEKAGAMVEQLEASARAVEDLRPKAEALAAAANVRAKSGDEEAAKALLADAADAAKGVPGHANRAYALLAVAAATAANGDPKAALKLLAEAEKSAGKVGDPEGQREAIEKIRAQQRVIGRQKAS